MSSMDLISSLLLNKEVSLGFNKITDLSFIFYANKIHLHTIIA